MLWYNFDYIEVRCRAGAREPRQGDDKLRRATYTKELVAQLNYSACNGHDKINSP